MEKTRNDSGVEMFNTKRQFLKSFSDSSFMNLHKYFQYMLLNGARKLFCEDPKDFSEQLINICFVGLEQSRRNRFSLMTKQNQIT